MFEYLCTNCFEKNIRLEDNNTCRKCGYQIISKNWQLVLDHYIRQEEGIIDYIKRVPFEEHQKETYSPFLFDFYVNVGAGIEQILKSISDWALFDGVRNIDLLRCQRRNEANDDFIRPNIGMYMTSLDPFFHFQKHKIRMKLNYDLIDPFEQLNLRGNGTLWPEFNVYSKDKHRWLDEQKEFRIDTLIHLLGSYFLLLCLNPYEGGYETLSINNIIKAGLCREVGFRFEIETHQRPLSEHLSVLRRLILEQWSKKTGTPYCYKFETKLFIFLFEYHNGDYRNRSPDYALIHV